MKTFRILLLITIYLLGFGLAYGQCDIISYTYDYGGFKDDPLTITVGDIYKKVKEKGNPWTDTTWTYIKIMDIRSGWVKYCINESVSRFGSDKQYYIYDEVHNFYLYYIYRGEPYFIQNKLNQR